MMESVMIPVDARKLMRARLAKGLTQDELAEKAKRSKDTIIRWESGRDWRPHPHVLKDIADALDVTPDDLLKD